MDIGAQIIWINMDFDFYSQVTWPTLFAPKPINIFKDTWGHRSFSVSHSTEEKRKTNQWGVEQASLLWHVRVGLNSCLISQRSQVICHVGRCSVRCMVGSPPERHLWTCSSSWLCAHTRTHPGSLGALCPCKPCCLSTLLLQHIQLDISVWFIWFSSW